MAKMRDDEPLLIKCPNCRQIHEPEFNETTHRFECPLCSANLDAQVIIEKKKRGLK